MLCEGAFNQLEEEQFGKAIEQACYVWHHKKTFLHGVHHGTEVIKLKYSLKTQNKAQ